MSYVDKNVEFSDAQAVTATAISSNVYDIFATGKGGQNPISPNTGIDIGNGNNNDLYLVVSTAVAITDTGSDATLNVTFETADNEAMSTNLTVLAQTGVKAFATYAAAGSQVWVIKLPIAMYRRYIGVRYTVAAGPFTAGAFDAYITTEINSNRVYKSGFTVQ